MKSKLVFGLLFLLMLSASAVSAQTTENFGLYKKLYDDGDDSVYELIWVSYDQAIYELPNDPGDFAIDSGGSCDGGGDVIVICPNSVNSTSFGEMDRIVVIGRRPARHIWIFDLWEDGDWGSAFTERFGRVASLGSSGSLGQYKRLGDIAINAQQLAELAASIMNLTIQWALADIQRFRDYGLHVTNPQGSVIPWQDAQVDWNEFGADDPSLSNEDVLANLISALNQP